jgi:GntR family transcriptional repressor for pyruvate dehydrogenase complex
MSKAFAFKSVRQKEKLSHLVLGSIKDALISGKLKPGDKLPPMSELARQMDVGISSIREAVKMLEGLDILESRQGDGTFVSDGLSDSAFNALSLQLMLLPRSAEALVDFRRMYETAYSRMAMDNATQEDLRALEAIVAAQEEKAKQAYPGAEDERDFHFAVLRCTNNPYVIRIGQALVELFLSTIPTSGEMLNRFSIARDHRNILEAIRAKDTALLGEVLEKSFSGWGQRLSGQDYAEEPL